LNKTRGGGSILNWWIIKKGINFRLVLTTMDDLYIKGQGIDKLQGKVTRFFQTQIVKQEKIRLTNGLGQLPTGNTRFRLMNLSRSHYQDRLMAQEFDFVVAPL